jgi:hypothetical protein
MDGHRDTYRRSQLNFNFPARLPFNEQALQIIQLFYDWGRQIKANFCIYWRHSDRKKSAQYRKNKRISVSAADLANITLYC